MSQVRWARDSWCTWGVYMEDSSNRHACDDSDLQEFINEIASSPQRTDSILTKPLHFARVCVRMCPPVVYPQTALTYRSTWLTCAPTHFRICCRAPVDICLCLRVPALRLLPAERPNLEVPLP